MIAVTGSANATVALDETQHSVMGKLLSSLTFGYITKQAIA
jgi:hypothetical protein